MMSLDVPVAPPLQPTPAGKGDQIEDELLFVGIVEQLELPVPGLRQLPRHLQKRLQIFFKFALPVPPCHRCGDTSGVRFRYFINANKSWHLQPRYQCFSTCCCTTTANPHSASTLFTLNRKKYAAHLQHHGGLYTILKNNTMILNNCNTSKSLCQQATTSNLLVRRHKSPLTLLLPAATQPPAPAVSQSPPCTMSYGLQVGAYNWTTMAAVSPSTEMYSIDESAVVNWENFLSECQELRPEDVLKDTSCLVDTRAFEFPSEGQLPDNMRNAHHLNLNNQSDILSSANSVSCMTAEELDELALKIVVSGFEHDLLSIVFPDIDLPDLVGSIDLPSLDFDPPFNLEATSCSPFERFDTSVTASF